MKSAKVWLFEFFEYYQGFKRIILVYVGWYVYFVTANIFAIATLVVTYKTSVIEATGMIATILTFPSALVAFVTKLYFDGRKNASDSDHS